MTHLADLVRFRVNLSRYMIVGGLVVFVITGGPYYALLSPPLAAPAIGEVTAYRWYDGARASEPVEVSVIRYVDANGARQEIERVGHWVTAVPLHYSQWQTGIAALDGTQTGAGSYVWLIGVALAGAGLALAAHSGWRIHTYNRNLRRVLRR